MRVTGDGQASSEWRVSGSPSGSPGSRPVAVVVRNGALGDFILTLPVIDTLLARGFDVRVACPERYRVLLPVGASHLAGRWPFEPSPEIDPAVIDVAVAFSSVTDASLRALGIANVRTVTPRPPDGVHAADHYARVLSPRAVGRPSVHVEGARAGGDAPVCIAPGSGGREKRWPLARWRAVHERLIEVGVPVVWLAGPDEEDTDVWPVPPVSPDLRGLCERAATAGCWLGPDAGPSHLAAATGTPTGVVFGPTDPGQWAPAGARVFPWSISPAEVAAWAIDARTRCLRAR